MNYQRSIFSLVVITFLLTACGPNYILDETRELASDGWSYTDPLEFEVDIKDTLKIYNLFLEVKHSVDYGYQNMYIQIYTEFPSGEKIKERVSLELADKVGGWFGDCNSENCTIRIPIQEGAFFNVPGHYKFKLEQFMRKERLPNIEYISFQIEDTGVSR